MRRACASKVSAAGAGHESPHGSGIDVGLREHAAAEQHGDFRGVDLIVFGLAAVDGFHGEGVSEHEGDALAGTQVREPVPREDAFDTDDQVLSLGRNGLEKGGRARGHIAVD